MSAPHEPKETQSTVPAESTPSRYIILDTCIISCFSNDELGNKILDVLREAVGFGYGIAISAITILESVNGTSVETEVKMAEVLDGIEVFEIDKEILYGSAHIGGIYKAHNLQLDQFGVGDQIIAATSIIRNALIFTKNGRDFPTPMFKELDRRMIEYTSKEWPVCMPFYFMEPQNEYIGAHYNKRLEEYTDKIKKAGEKAAKKAEYEKRKVEEDKSAN